MDRERGVLLIVGRIYMPSPIILPVAACNRNGLDLQSSHFSTGINCVYPSQQTEIICE
ncbi:hypothetical protein ALQ25_200277 [Pseudomonas coronafaciens pv. atropurpurea]|nr:hypothetical protein ALQ25_200277 [Pseudomonas coronafaciens pv. atropurpurea]RMQ36046.1 hypothetical protein ALQ06_200108 [Pseudomonas syringae pv. berberidis]